jgi:predicted HAD superfamily Cof-like phosphohydrolase
MTTEYNEITQWCETFAASHDPQLWFSLIEEEFKELEAAFKAGDMVELLDGMVDLVWVVKGMAYCLGIDYDQAFSEVLRSNHSKAWPDGPHFNEVGKVMKGPNFSPPDLRKFVEHLL